jgi:hypothetical protein
MTRQIRIGLAALAALIAATSMVLSAGAGGPLSQQPATGAFRAVLPDVASDSVSAGTVTLANDLGTIQMQPGDTFLLMLGTGWNWDVTVSDTSALRRVPNITVIVGAQGIYQALQPGTVTLTAIGSLVCSPGTACPLLARVFRVTVVVQ